MPNPCTLRWWSIDARRRPSVSGRVDGRHVDAVVGQSPAQVVGLGLDHGPGREVERGQVHLVVEPDVRQLEASRPRRRRRSWSAAGAPRCSRSNTKSARSVSGNHMPNPPARATLERDRARPRISDAPPAATTSWSTSSRWSAGQQRRRFDDQSLLSHVVGHPLEAQGRLTGSEEVPAAPVPQPADTGPLVEAVAAVAGGTSHRRTRRRSSSAGGVPGGAARSRTPPDRRHGAPAPAAGPHGRCRRADRRAARQ